MSRSARISQNMRSIAALTICLLFSGCIVLQPRAENPFPNMTTVAVVPFFNQSAVPGEINDLGRTFGLSYTAELQKFEGYDVMAFGVVETAIIEYNKAAAIRGEAQLNLGNAEDVLVLAKLLDVDAIVIGAITTFNPYYPPEIGLKVNWYSNKNWTMSPQGTPCGPCDDSMLDEYGECPCGDVNWPKLRTKDNHSVIRGQNAVSLFEYEAEPLLGFDSGPQRISTQGTSAANRAMNVEETIVALPAQQPAARSWGNTGAVVPPVDPQSAKSPVQLLHPVTPFALGDDPSQYGPIVRQTPQRIHLANQVPISLQPESEIVVQAKSQYTSSVDARDAIDGDERGRK